MNIALVHRYYSLNGAITPIIDASIKEYNKQEIKYFLFSENLKGNENTRPFANAIKFYWNIFQEIKQKKFDLVVTHSYPVCFLRPFIKTPIVLFIHNTGREENKVEVSSFSAKISAFFRALSFRFADKLISVSDMTRNIILENYEINPKKVVTVHNGVNIDIFREVECNKDTKRFIILHRGTDARKGFDLVLSWSNSIIKKNPRIYFLILGKKNSIIPTKISNHFKFIEWVNYKAMPEMYSLSDLVISPSRYDPFPGVPLEAMACKRPVMMSDMCGTKDLIKQGKNGFVSNLKNFPEEIIKVSKLSRKELSEIGNNARRTIVKDLSWPNIIKKQRKVFKDVIRDNTYKK